MTGYSSFDKRKKMAESQEMLVDSFQETSLTEITCLSEAIEYIEKGPKRIKDNKLLADSIKILWDQSSTVGVDHSYLLRVGHVICSSKFGPSMVNKLLLCMIPSQTVPTKIIFNVVSFICSQKSSLNVKVSLLKWFVAVYDYLESVEDVHSLYDVIFHFIDHSTLCPHVCHLLYLMTQKDDVKPFWVRRLMKIKTMLCDHPFVEGLLALFQLFRPDLVTIQPGSTVVKFSTGRWQFLERLRKVQSVNSGIRSAVSSSEAHQQSLRRKISEDLMRLTVPFRSKVRGDVVPPIRCVTLEESNAEKFTFHQMKTFKEMVEKIHLLQLPSQISSIIRHPALRMVVLNLNDDTITCRISSWFESNLYKDLIIQKTDDGYERREKLLDATVEFSENIQEGIPHIEDVLVQYLTSWNGIEHRCQILTLISRWRLCPFSQLKVAILNPLQKLFFRSSLFFKCSVIDCLTKLIQNMAMIELARYAAMQHHRLMQNTEKVDVPFRSIFHTPIYERFNVLDMFESVIKFVQNISDVGLMVHNYHILLLHQVLGFYEVCSQLYTSFGIPCMFVMSSTTLNATLYSMDAMSVSRMSNLLLSYKITSEAMTEQGMPHKFDDLLKKYNDGVRRTLFNGKHDVNVEDNIIDSSPNKYLLPK